MLLRGTGLLACFGATLVISQTTQGLISGRLVDSVTGRPIKEAKITYSSSSSNLAGVAVSDDSGYYYLPLLSPGFYQLRATAVAYQSQELQELELTVAAHVELDFRLRPLSDVWEAGQYRSVFLPGSKAIVNFYGPDVDTSRSGSFEAQKGKQAPLESTVSEVIDSAEINNLPLQGRDVYTMLVTQPGVTSDASTGRGLGLSVNGQRPSSSNFLLDGVENNNYLITGPLVTVAPEAIQEYRISTNNFSAEYGRTSGFLANAITRAGTPRFHGVGYFYLKNAVLNANDFQDNLAGRIRPPDNETEPGFVITGPVLRNRLFFSTAFDHFRSRSQQAPESFTVPSANFVADFTAPNSLARQLLSQFPAPVANTGNQLTGVVTLAPPVSLDRTVAIERLDYSRPGGEDRVMGRVLINRLARPDFIWTPYPDFVSALHDYTWAAGLSYIHSFRPNLTNETRLSYSDDNLHWNRPHPEIPTLVTGDSLTLPGSPAFYSYKNVNGSWELLDNVIWSRGRHLITVGAGLLRRSSDGFLTAGQVPEYIFDNIVRFAVGSPSTVSVAVERTAAPLLEQPQYDRSYRYNQYFLFAQDSYKVSSRLTANYGLRYEYYGAPTNVGPVKDALIQLPSGANLAQSLTGATVVKPSSSADQQEFGADKKDIAVRVGAAYDLSGTGRTLMRGAYGIFYDRPFDNLWQNVRNNNLIVPLFGLPAGSFNYLAPVSTLLSALQGSSVSNNFPDMTLVDPGLRNGYVHSYFAGVQQRVTNDFTIELDALGSYGRRLIATDIVNRDFSTPTGRYNPNLPDIAYRSSQGFSDYNALAAVVRYRTSRGMVQGTYTWSHTIDNQSDPLTGDFFNLNFTSIESSAASNGRATFSEQFNPLADRGNSDFDQRHNLVIFSYWNPPSLFDRSKLGILFRGWTFSELAAFRSGLPYTVFGTSDVIDGGGLILNNRPNLVDPNNAVLANPVPVAGGKQLLNPNAFANAAASMLGNLGRNSFSGPGFYSIDLSVARSFNLPWLGETGRLRFRADAYNVLNHANLNNPDPELTSPTFGIALFGRTGRATGFPALTPLNETARQIQLSVRLEF